MNGAELKWDDPRQASVMAECVRRSISDSCSAIRGVMCQFVNKTPIIIVIHDMDSHEGSLCFEDGGHLASNLRSSLDVPDDVKIIVVDPSNDTWATGDFKESP